MAGERSVRLSHKQTKPMPPQSSHADQSDSGAPRATSEAAVSHAVGALPSQWHSIIVVGASAGGLRPLRQILSGLPAGLPAAIFVVLHVGASSDLTQVLAHRTALPVHAATSGTTIEPGHVYVAIPDCHLLLHDQHLLLRRGPRENLTRPAIDPLFRSAACTFARRVIGVLLSGTMNDGTAGLLAIKRCGGLSIVQDPADAAYPEMPISALHHVVVDHVAAAANIPALLSHLVRQPAGDAPSIPFDIRLETAIAAGELASMETNQALGKLSPFACPECHGVLWEIDDEGMMRYRCHVGHAFTAETVQMDQVRRAEELLWNLLRGHEERAALTDRMAAKERAMHRDDLAAKLGERANGYQEDANTIRRLLREVRAEHAGGADQETP
jgi:two-component system, chemotaxis family, protein-glutamate methylesterase/glutaminase